MPPDFRKALDRLAGSNGRIPSRTAARPVLSLSRQLEFLREGNRTAPLLPFGRPAIEDLLPPGDVEKTRFGHHYVVRNVYPADHHHGRIRLERFSSGDLSVLMELMHSKALAPDRDNIVFLDTETTGVQGGTGTVPFLIGLGYFRGPEFHLPIFFMRDFDEEASMLQALADLLKQFDLIITYNGAAFDLPLLETRFKLSRLPHPLGRIHHFDMLPPARKLWRDSRGSCKLTALEHGLLSFLRGPDIPGAEIPRAYFDFLARRPSPVMRGVFRHNAFDVLSLAALTVQAADRVTLDPARLDEPAEIFALARVLENSALWTRCRNLYESALQGGLTEALKVRAMERLSLVCRRSGDLEAAFDWSRHLMRSPAFSFVGYESASIYLERTAGDWDAALAVVDEALDRLSTGPSKPRWRKSLEARRDRLSQKLKAGRLA